MKMNIVLPDNVEAVLFDLDGTLVDSMWMWKAIDIEYLGRFNIAYEEDLQKRIEGMSFSETAVYFKEYFGIKDSLEKMKSDWNDMAMDKYKHQVGLKPGALEFLKLLREKNIKTGLATSNSIELVKAVFDSLGLWEYIDTVVTGCEVKKGKPSPDIYLEAAKRLKVSSQGCLVFEDIVPGILAGKAAGMRVFAVDDPYSISDVEDKKRLSDGYISDYRELIEVINV